MQFPEYRARRMRRSDGLRRLVREISLSQDSFIYPLFVCPGRDVRRPITSLPGQAQVSVDQAVREAKECLDLGIPAIILFGVPDESRKDSVGSEAWNSDGLVQQATRAIKRACPEMVIMTDACFDEYTSHGHCGVVLPEGGWGDLRVVGSTASNSSAVEGALRRRSPVVPSVSTTLAQAPGPSAGAYLARCCSRPSNPRCTV